MGAFTAVGGAASLIEPEAWGGKFSAQLRIAPVVPGVFKWTTLKRRISSGAKGTAEVEELQAALAKGTQHSMGDKLEPMPRVEYGEKRKFAQQGHHPFYGYSQGYSSNASHDQGSAGLMAMQAHGVDQFIHLGGFYPILSPIQTMGQGSSGSLGSVQGVFPPDDAYQAQSLSLYMDPYSASNMLQPIQPAILYSGGGNLYDPYDPSGQFQLGMNPACSQQWQPIRTAPRHRQHASQPYTRHYPHGR